MLQDPNGVPYFHPEYPEKSKLTVKIDGDVRGAGKKILMAVIHNALVKAGYTNVDIASILPPPADPQATPEQKRVSITISETLSPQRDK